MNNIKDYNYHNAIYNNRINYNIRDYFIVKKATTSLKLPLKLLEEEITEMNFPPLNLENTDDQLYEWIKNNWKVNPKMRKRELEWLKDETLGLEMAYEELLDQYYDDQKVFENYKIAYAYYESQTNLSKEFDPFLFDSAKYY